MAGHRGAAGVVQCDPRPSSAFRALATGAGLSSVGESGAQRVNRNAYDVSGSFSPGRPRFNPDVALESARKRVAGLEAAISAMLSNGLDETSAEVRSLQDSLTKAKRSAQEAPLEVQVKGAQEFIERAQKRLAAQDAVRTELEKELAVGQARLHHLRMQVEAMPKPQPDAQDLPPPEWVAEIQRLRAELPITRRIDLSGIQSKQPRMCVRRPRNAGAGLMDDMPTDEQGIEVVVGGQKPGDARCSRRGRHRGDLFVGAIGKFQTKNSDFDQLLERVDSHHIEIGDTQVCCQVWAPRHTGGGSCSSEAISSIEKTG